MRTLNIRCFHEHFRKWTKGFWLATLVAWLRWFGGTADGCPTIVEAVQTEGEDPLPPPPLKPLICVSSQPAIQNQPPLPYPSLDQPYWPSAEDGYRASMQNMGHWFWILVCAFKLFYLFLLVLWIRDVYPGSRIRLFSSRIQGWQDSGFRIRSRIKEHRVLKNKIRSSQIPDPGSWIWIFFPSRIPDPGVKKSPDLDPQHWFLHSYLVE